MVRVKTKFSVASRYVYTPLDIPPASQLVRYAQGPILSATNTSSRRPVALDTSSCSSPFAGKGKVDTDTD